MEYHFSFHFPPSIALDRFYDECHRLMRTLFEAGIYTGTFYSGGRSLKDALSRPIDLTTPEAFKARMKKENFGFSLELNWLVSLWAPEFGASINFSSVFTRNWVKFELQVRSPESYERAIAWLNSVCERRLFDGLIVVHEIYGAPGFPILRLIEGGRDLDISGLSVSERWQLYLAKTDALV